MILIHDPPQHFRRDCRLKAHLVSTHCLYYLPTYDTTMSSQSKGKKKKTATSVFELPGINWRENPQEGSSLILSVLKEAAMLAPIATLKQAACSALLIFKTTQVCTRKNNESYHN